MFIRNQKMAILSKFFGENLLINVLTVVCWQLRIGVLSQNKAVPALIEGFMEKNLSYPG